VGRSCWHLRGDLEAPIPGWPDRRQPRPELFTHYAVQDAHYLRDFAHTLTVVGSKAPTHAGVGMFARHAAGTAEVELAFARLRLSTVPT
jgi:hypothetical protein